VKKHVEALISLENAEIVVVCDRIEDRAKRVADEIGCPYETDYHQLLSREDIDVIDICTPPETHEKIVIDVAHAKKHIVCEKPMAVRMSEARNMIDAAKKANVRFFIVKQNRYNPPIVKLKESLEKNRFGRLFLLNATVRWNRGQEYYDEDSWRSKKNGGCGVLLNQTSHHLDMLHYLGGPIKTVSCKTETFAHTIEQEDAAVALFRFENGALGTFEGSTCAFPDNIEGSVTILGKNGSVKIGGFAINQVDLWKFKDNLGEDTMTKEIATNPPNVYGFGHAGVMDEVINCIESNQESHLDAEKVKEGFRVIMAMQKSAKENKEIVVSEVTDDDDNFYT
jgi:UDP-N-acetyl-2-amino-2-deoxyglucuronate dehydrogenase